MNISDRHGAGGCRQTESPAWPPKFSSTAAWEAAGLEPYWQAQKKPNLRSVCSPERTESQPGPGKGLAREGAGGLGTSPGGVFCIRSSSKNSNRAVFLLPLQVPHSRGEHGCIICGLHVLCLVPVVCFPALKAKPCMAQRWKADHGLSARPFVMSPRGGWELLQP